MINNPQELENRVREASAALQEISDFLRDHPRNEALGKVRFPRGYLRTAAEHRARLPFIASRTLRDNVSYALMTHDVLRWLSSRTDLSGQALEMVTKEAVCLLGTVCESISIYPTQHGLGRGSGFNRRIRRLVEMNVIDALAEERLNWLWTKRNQEHLVDVLFREWNHYTPRDWTDSVAAYHALRDGLDRWHAAGFPRRGLPPA
jgi:hypothetical protein